MGGTTRTIARDIGASRADSQEDVDSAEDIESFEATEQIEAEDDDRWRV
jgi:hypothetical protein